MKTKQTEIVQKIVLIKLMKINFINNKQTMNKEKF